METERTTASLTAELAILAPALRFDGFSSESDMPMQHYVTDETVSEMTLDHLSAAVGHALEDCTDTIGETLDGMVRVAERFGEMVEVSRAFVRLMRGLSPLVGGVAKDIDGDERPAWLVGRSPEGHIIGVQTAVVWT
ncbi:MAG: hypothetical protein AAFV53_24875 [Myxococcota bacterium]